MSNRIVKPTHLYKHLLRCIQQLPPESQAHYKHHVKQGFNSHSDETDDERIKQIVQRAVEDAAWVLQKYSEKKS